MDVSDNFNMIDDTEACAKSKALVIETFGCVRENYVYPIITRANGDVEICKPVRNSRVNSGSSFCANQISGTAVAVANYMALCPTQQTITATDTTLTGEISANGCARALSSFGSLVAASVVNGTASYNLTKTFNCATASQAIGGVAIFNASSAGTMLVEAQLSQVYSLNVGDSLAITYSFTC